LVQIYNSYKKKLILQGGAPTLLRCNEICMTFYCTFLLIFRQCESQKNSYTEFSFTWTDFLNSVTKTLGKIFAIKRLTDFR